MGQADLPVASGAQHVKAFGQFGWELRPAKRNHFVLHKPGHAAHISIPNHREVKRALLAKQLKLAGITEAAYCAAFERVC